MRIVAGDEVFDTATVQVGPSDLVAIGDPVHLACRYVQDDGPRTAEIGTEVFDTATVQIGPLYLAGVDPVHLAHLHDHPPVGRQGHMADCVDGV